MFRVFLIFLVAISANAAGLPDTVARIKPSIVGVATFLPTRAPHVQFRGTGFVVGDGLTVVTNLHVLAKGVDTESGEVLGILVGQGSELQFRRGRKIAEDESHDLAVMRIGGAPLPPLVVGDSDTVREGDELYMIGYPLGPVLGLYTATHRALVAGIPPVYTPRPSASQVDLRLLRKIGAPFRVFQLDANAYPGNSGSPLFDPASGAVLGVINQVLLKSAKEGPNHPSGITYAIPARYVRELVRTSAASGDADAVPGGGNAHLPAKTPVN
jgi:S1-C subfamily serine protease